MTLSSSIVISGTGLITSLGRGRSDVLDAIIAGRVGLGPMHLLEQRPDPDLGGGQAIEIAPEPGVENRDRASMYLRASVRDAISDAALQPEDGRRIAVVLGSTLHGMRSAGRYFRTNRLDDLRGFLAGSVIDDAVGGLGIGPIRLTTCAACSSGLSSVGLGVTLLRSGIVDAVVAGGYDTVSEYVYAGFNSLRLIAPEAIVPFASDRAGMKVAEGYGTLVLERADDVAGRGGRALAAVGGYGECSDSFHLTHPRPDGSGVADAIAQALEESRLTPSQIGLISAHGTGTPQNDAAEYQGLSRAFGNRLGRTPVVGFKGALGHTLGAAGAVELILSLEAMLRQCVPPTPGAARVDPGFSDLRLATEPVSVSPMEGTLNISLGFGGANTAVALHPPRSISSRARGVTDADRLRPVITGVGIVLPATVGFELFGQKLRSRQRLVAPEDPGTEYVNLLASRRLRRVSSYAKLTLAAATDACRHASFSARESSPCSAILGTTHGSPDFCARYYRQVVDEGMGAANPVLFAEGVPNAAAAHLSMELGLSGGCQTIIGTRTAGLEALVLAGMRIREGRVSRCVVAAAEEYSEVADRAHAYCRSRAPRDGAPGAIALLVESRAAAESRGARVLATLGRSGWADTLPNTPDVWGQAGRRPPAAWIDIPGIQPDAISGLAETRYSVEALCPEMYSVSSLVAVAAILAGSGGVSSVVSGKTLDRVCGLELSV